ncbi:beta propeller repeat protein [Natronorarus salvus]|uniref:glycosyl hydrolase n=1 Tax=Natronorarus salvus TaxID=3117733 RepID=UPI002F269E60
MKLGGIVDGRIYASVGRSILGEREGGEGFERVGRVPNPERGRRRPVYGLTTDRRGRALLSPVVGRFPSLTLFPITADLLFAASWRWLFVSRDGGRSWAVSRELPPSSGPKGLLPTGLCHHEGDVYLGEYPLAIDTVPRVLRSEDEGRSWETALSLPDVRHVHAVRADPYTGDLWITTGDTDRESRIGRLRGGSFEVVGSGSQRWRAVDLAFTPESVLWGMDSVYAERNLLFRLDRDALSEGRPEVVHAVDGSVFYATTVETGGERWAVFSTSAESGPDSTAPPEERGTTATDRVRVVAASDANEYTEWTEVVSYGRRRALVDRVNPGGLAPSAGAYVYLDADRERGVVLNPYNTDRDDGRLLRLPVDPARSGLACAVLAA